MICRLLFLFRTTIRSLLNCLPYVLTCQCVLLSYVLTCLACLHTCVSTCFACSRANVSAYFRAHVPTCFACLRTNLSCVLACCRAHVLTCLTCSRANVSLRATCYNFKYQKKKVFNDMLSLDFWYFFLVSILWNRSTTSKNVSRISFSDFSCTFRHISYQAENFKCYDKLCTIQWFWFLFE